MTFKQFKYKYCNKITFISSTISTIIIYYIMFNFIQYILLEFVFSNKQPYINNNISIWNEWYKVYPDEKHELIDLRPPLFSDYAINSKYKYEKPFDEIVKEYKKILEKENWQFLQKGENSITYVKDGLLFSIIKLPDGFLQTKVWLKSDMK